MAISKIANGFYTFSDNHFKAMRKQDLINYIRTIEKNWQNSLITNDIQYENCKRLLAEERNKAIDEFAEEIRDWQIDIQDNEHDADKFDFVFERIFEIAQELKAGGKNE